MDFLFFEKLSEKEAKQYLDQFLYSAKEGVKEMNSQLETDNVNLDFSLNSITPFILSIKSKLESIPVKVDDTLPDWIKSSDIYKKGLYSFNEFSKILILRASYYFGECFVDSSKNLYWDLGSINSAVYKMPVVKGFKYKMELAPLLVCENLISRVYDGDGTETISTAIEYWKKLL